MKIRHVRNASVCWVDMLIVNPRNVHLAKMNYVPLSALVASVSVSHVPNIKNFVNQAVTAYRHYFGVMVCEIAQMMRMPLVLINLRSNANRKRKKMKVSFAIKY